MDSDLKCLNCRVASAGGLCQKSIVFSGCLRSENLDVLDFQFRTDKFLCVLLLHVIVLDLVMNHRVHPIQPFPDPSIEKCPRKWQIAIPASLMWSGDGGAQLKRPIFQAFREHMALL